VKGLEKEECVRWKAWMRLLSMWLVVGSSLYIYIYIYMYCLICVESVLMSSKLCL
jgi:hypothetical protein